MRLLFYISSGKDRELSVATSLAAGAAFAGDTVDLRYTGEFREPEDHVDAVCVFGLKGHSREILDVYRVRAKAGTLLFDKALIRVEGANGYYRVSINDNSPYSTMTRGPYGPERWTKLNLRILPRRYVEDGGIIIAPSSEKYHSFHRLPNVEIWVDRVRDQLRSLGAPIVVHDKDDLISLSQLLPSARALVTHGSSAAIDAILSGVPAVVLGRSAASPVAGKNYWEVLDPMFPPDHARQQWAYNLAWCQWTEPELASGEAWDFIKPQLE